MRCAWLNYFVPRNLFNHSPEANAAPAGAGSRGAQAV